MQQGGYLSSTQTLQSFFSSFTTGSVIFQGPNGFLVQNNANLFWDNNGLQLKIQGGNNTNNNPPLLVNYLGTNSFNNARLAQLLAPSNPTGSTVLFQIGNADGSNYNSGSLGFTYVGANNSLNYISLGLYGNYPVFNILGNGNVGIGTTSPNFNLEINGTLAATQLYGRTTSQNANDTLFLGNGANTNFFLDRPSAGNQLVFGYNTPKSTNGSNTLSIYNNSTDRNVLATFQSKGTTAGNDYVLLGNPTANVGINNNAPAFPLDVSGQIASSGENIRGSTSGVFTQKAAATTTSYSVNWPAAQGAANTSLQNDGSGNLSWSAPVTSNNYEVSSTSNISTTSTTLTLMTGMTITPVAGTYLVMFSSSAYQSTGNDSVGIALYNGTTAKSDSLRQANTFQGILQGFMPIATQGIMVMNGTNAVNVYWNANGGTATVSYRTLSLVRIA